MITRDFAAATAEPFDVCVIGSGPVGLAVAITLGGLGRRVLVLEAGGDRQTPRAQALSDHELVDSTIHQPPMSTVARRLGGASNLWGGRCTPYGAVDFDERPWIGDARWPIGHDDIAPYYAAACTHLDAGAPVFVSPIPGVAATDDAFRGDLLERFSNRFRNQELHAQALRAHRDVRILLDTVTTGLRFDDGGAVTGLDLWRPEGASVALPARRVVVAAGGNETARLLLAAQRHAPTRFGGADGPLGRHYMAHLTGSIADIVFDDAAADAAYDFHVDAHGGYARRRIAPSRDLLNAERLRNISFFPVVHDVADARHGSGPLSMAYLALSIGPLGRLLVAEAIRRKHAGDRPRDVARHLGNMLREPFRLAAFAPWFIWNRRYARHRLPGFYLRNRNRRYALEYHGEQSPLPDSRLTLSSRTDASGLPLLLIDYRVARADAESVVRAHDLLGGWLARTGIGRLEHRRPPEARADAAMAEVLHGTHQIGTVRMAPTPGGGVVDRDCAVFGASGLFVASTAVLPTSGNVSPTLIATALAIRLAHHIAGNIGGA